MYFQRINKKIIRAAFFAAFFCLFSVWQAEAALPEHIAVLPIEGEGKAEDLNELRVTFFNHIGSKNYRDMELADIDSKLFLAQQQTGKKWRDMTPKEVADILGVQGLMYLNVVGIDKIYAGVYGSLTVTLDVKFVEAETGRIIWHKEDKVVRQSGGVPLSPWSAISTAISSALVLRDTVKIELFDKLCRQIAGDLPEPPSLAAERPPTIFSVVTNALDSPFKAHEELLISLKGDEGLEAYFNIVGQTDAVKLQEIKPGQYLGKYIIKDGDNFESQLVEVFLLNPVKRKVSKYQVPYLVTADTTPPGTPADITTGVSESGMKISWSKPADDDVAGYIIKKAVVGQSQYRDLADTELTEFVDTEVGFGEKIYYRVYTKDRADNLSKPAELIQMVVKPGPTDVTGELKEDTVFYKYGSPYIVQGELSVAKGVKLTIEAGSVVRFEDGASLIINGSVESLGSEQEGVSFKGKGYGIFMSDTGSGGGLFRHTFFRNGGIFDISNSESIFENCRFESFATALKMAHDSDVKIKNSVYSYNEQGIFALSGKLNLENTEFSHNKEGLSVLSDVSASGGDIVFKENLLDVSAETELNIERAEIPDKESFDIIRSFRGPVKIKYVMPHRKSLADIKNDSENDLLEKIGDGLIEEEYEETLKYTALLKELFQERYIDIMPLEGFALFKLSRQKEAKDIISSSDAEYVQMMSESLGLSEQTVSPAKVRFVNVRIPVFGSGEGLGKIALGKAVKQSVKEYVDSLTGKLERKKSFIVKDKILSDTDKYATGVFPIAVKVSKSRFDGLYIVFLKTNTVLADLQDLRIIGDKKREIKVGLTSCGDGDIVRPVIAKELSTLLFPVAEYPSKGCGFSEYKADAEKSDIDILMVVKEGYSASESRVSKNLKMISADMDVVIYDTKTGLQLFDTSKGQVVYHMNESMGKKVGIQKAFDSVRENILDKVVQIERDRAPEEPAMAQISEPQQKASTASAAKKQDVSVKKTDSGKGLKLSVAGVEPVFANIPYAFVKKPFMTLLIENESDQNIGQSELTLDVPGYFSSAVSTELESIPASDKVRLKLFAEFTDDLKKVDKTKKTDAVISIKYGTKKTEIKYPVVIFDSHTTRWNEGGKIALFSDHSDPSVVSLAEDILVQSEKLSADEKLKKFFAGLTAFDYLSGAGYVYEADAKRPFKDVYGSNTKVDTSKYPSEFLSDKKGDADDILIAYGAVLKAMDIDFAFTVSENTVVGMFDTSIPEELREKLGFEKNSVVIYDENIWIPMNIEMIKEGASAAWKSGAETASALGDKTKMVVLSKSYEKYSPVTIYRKEFRSVPAETFAPRFAELKKVFAD